jgi:hypothetical protein
VDTSSCSHGDYSSSTRPVRARNVKIRPTTASRANQALIEDNIGGIKQIPYEGTAGSEEQM